MRTPRTFAERTEQLGRIAFLELELTKRNNPRTWRKPLPQPRTNGAKRILWQYLTNVFGFVPNAEELHFNKELKSRYECEKFTTAQFNGMK
jgi:hypothetical protein